MAPPLRVAVVGAGLLGRLVAWRLARRGARVDVFECGGPDGATAAGRTAAGMLAPWSESPHTPPDVFEIGRNALTAWPDLLEQLRGDAGRAVPMTAGGSLLVAHRADEPQLARLERAVRRLVDDESVRRLDGAALARLEPALAERFRTGLWMAAEASIDTGALFDALLAALERLGTALHFGTRVAVPEPGCVDDGTQRRFHWVIDCRGAAARCELRGLRGVRGEVIRVRAPEVALARPVRLLHPRYPLYVVPRPDGHFVVGATEIESESDAGVTVRSALELLSALFSLHPGFAEAEILSLERNLRPAYDDHRPRVEIEDGVIRMNGLYRHGYLLAPELTGRVVGFLLGDEQTHGAASEEYAL